MTVLFRVRICLRGITFAGVLVRVQSPLRERIKADRDCRSSKGNLSGGAAGGVDARGYPYAGQGWIGKLGGGPPFRV